MRTLDDELYNSIQIERAKMRPFILIAVLQLGSLALLLILNTIKWW